MPTDRFYRLPEEKRQIIREAAIKEFARVPFEKASINQIILNADISRGSFYTYFEDKKDVVSFIFEDTHEQMQQCCIQILKDNGGDYFNMFAEMFNYFVEKLQETTDMIDMARNLSTNQENMDAMGFGGSPDALMLEETDISVRRLFDYVDKSNWQLEESDDFGTLLMLSITSLMVALSQFYKHPEKLDRIRILYEKKLKMLQYGIYREAAQQQA